MLSGSMAPTSSQKKENLAFGPRSHWKSVIKYKHITAAIRQPVTWQGKRKFDSQHVLGILKLLKFKSQKFTQDKFSLHS